MSETLRECEWESGRCSGEERRRSGREGGVDEESRCGWMRYRQDSCAAGVQESVSRRDLVIVNIQLCRGDGIV